MRTVIGLVAGLMAFCVSLSAFSQDVPAYLKKSKGVIIDGIHEVAAFELDPGKLGDCASSSSDAYRCKVKNAFATTVSKNGISRRFLFDEVGILFLTDESGDVTRRYNFMGMWQADESGTILSSETRLLLSNKASNPVNLKGTLELVDYRIVEGVEAAQAP